MAVNQELLLGQTREWIGAPDVREALGGTPGGDAYHAAVVSYRLELVRTALGVTLLDKYEEAQRGLEAGRVALRILGVEMGEPATQSPEAEPDRLLTFAGFIALGTTRKLGVRAWNRLRQEHVYWLEVAQAGEISMYADEQRKVELFGALFVDDRLSLRTLKGLAVGECSDLLDIRNFGTASLGFVKEVAQSEFDV